MAMLFVAPAILVVFRFLPALFFEARIEPAILVMIRLLVVLFLAARILLFFFAAVFRNGVFVFRNLIFALVPRAPAMARTAEADPAAAA